MAKVIDDDEFLTLELLILEKVGVLHGDIRVSKTNLVKVEIEENPWQ